MARVRNISNGPRGAYREGVLITVEAGKTVDADDWNKEWFVPVGEEGEDFVSPELADMDLPSLIQLAVAEGVIVSVDEARRGLIDAITAKRSGGNEGSDQNANLAEPSPLDQSVDDLTAYLANVGDIEEIDGLIAAETAGKSRKSALAALEARKAELTG